MQRSPSDEVNSYVGSVFTQTFLVRHLQSKLSALSPGASRPFDAWMRDHVLDVVMIPLVVGNFTKKEVLAQEQRCMDTYKPTLNVKRAVANLSESEYQKVWYLRKCESEDYRSARNLFFRRYLKESKRTCHVCGGSTSSISTREKRHFWLKTHQRQLLCFLG